MSNIAIYARKSVFREDSISIESQIEMCKYEARGEECVVYQDNGFSGKNTDRPDFKRMMNDIKSSVTNEIKTFFIITILLIWLKNLYPFHIPYHKALQYPLMSVKQLL